VRTTRSTAALAAVALLALVGCGDDDDPDPTTTTSTTTSTTVVDTTTSSTAVPADLGQPAIWPAADVVFETPEEAAEDFVQQVLGVPPALGEFQEGDARSGEVDVLSPGEGEVPSTVVRSRLLLRRLGPDDGWFVLAAVNDNASITTPDAGSDVAPGPLDVTGRARGFEANVVVRAFVAGSTDDLDQEVTTGGALETPEPFSVTLDLAGASRDDVVVLLVRGGTGLETDPGDFGAVPVVVGG
jgi:hypothetical protein